MPSVWWVPPFLLLTQSPKLGVQQAERRRCVLRTLGDCGRLRAGCPRPPDPLSWGGCLSAIGIPEDSALVARLTEERKDRPLESLGSGGTCQGRQVGGGEPRSPQAEMPERWESEVATRGHPRPAEGPGSLYKMWKVRRLGGGGQRGRWLQLTNVPVHYYWGSGRPCRCKIALLLRKIKGEKASGEPLGSIMDSLRQHALMEHLLCAKLNSTIRVKWSRSFLSEGQEVERAGPRLTPKLSCPRLGPGLDGVPLGWEPAHTWHPCRFQCLPRRRAEGSSGPV